MAEEGKYQSYETKAEEPCDSPVDVKAEAVETSDRGLFGVFGKKEEGKTCETDAIATEFDDKVKVCEDEQEPKHESLLQKLKRSDSSSSSSSSDEEEVDENGEKKKKKKIKDKIKEKITGDKKEEEDTCVPIEKCDEVPVVVPEAEKKGLLEKIKDKLPGGKKPEEVAVPAPAPVAECHAAVPEGEKKGFLEKIKEKIPGYHPKTAEEKEKEKETKEDC